MALSIMLVLPRVAPSGSNWYLSLQGIGSGSGGGGVGGGVGSLGVGGGDGVAGFGGLGGIFLAVHKLPPS